MGNVYSLASETLESKLGKAQSQGCPGCSAEPDLLQGSQQSVRGKATACKHTARKTLPATAPNPATVAYQPRDWGCQQQPSQALQEQRELCLGTMGMVGAWGSLWQEGLGVGHS